MTEELSCQALSSFPEPTTLSKLDRDRLSLRPTQPATRKGGAMAWLSGFPWEGEQVRGVSFREKKSVILQHECCGEQCLWSRFFQFLTKRAQALPERVLACFGGRLPVWVGAASLLTSPWGGVWWGEGGKCEPVTPWHVGTLVGQQQGGSQAPEIILEGGAERVLTRGGAGKWRLGMVGECGTVWWVPSGSHQAESPSIQISHIATSHTLL